MYRDCKKLIISIFLMFSMPMSASYAIPGSTLRDGVQKKTTNISEGQMTLAPFGYMIFCKNNPQDCQKHNKGKSVQTDDGKVVLDSVRWQQLQGINASYNSKIKPRTDREAHGQEEVWSLPKNYGDCEDYALAKRKALMQAGWPSSALRLAVAITPKGETHAVLVAKTSKGDYVLDNLSRSVKSWSATGYKWIKLQSSHNPMIWVDANGTSRSVKTQPARLQKVGGLEWENVPQAQRDKLKALWKSPR